MRESDCIEGLCSVLFVQFVFSSTDPNSPPVGKCSQVLMDLVDMNLSVLNGIDPFDLHESIRTNLNGERFLKCARIHIEDNILVTLNPVNIQG